MQGNKTTRRHVSLADPLDFYPAFQSDRVDRANARPTLAGAAAHAGLAEGIATIKGAVLSGVDLRFAWSAITAWRGCRPTAGWGRCGDRPHHVRGRARGD